MKFVVFSGSDLSGKTLAKEIFNKETNYRHLVIDRLFFSNYMYNKIFERNLEDQDKIIHELKKINKKLESPVFFILMIASKFRLKRNKEIRNSDENIDKLIREQDLFIENFNKFLNATESRGAMLLNEKKKGVLKGKISELITQYGF